MKNADRFTVDFQKIKKIILPSIAIILVLLYCSSFFAGKNQEKEKPFETALLNPAKENQLYKIILSNKTGSISFFKEKDLWISKNGEICFPIEVKQLETFLSKLKNIRKMYKNLYNINNNNVHFDNIFTISYILKEQSGAEHETFIDFYSTDFSGTKRFLKINGKDYFYKTENDLDSFFHTEARFWYDPYIVPQNVFGKIQESDIQDIFINGKNVGNLTQVNVSRLLELRHGSLCLLENRKGETPELSAKLILNDGNKINFSVYKKYEDEFLIRYNIAGILNYAAYISSWTYKNLAECIKTK